MQIGLGTSPCRLNQEERKALHISLGEGIASEQASKQTWFAKTRAAVTMVNAIASVSSQRHKCRPLLHINKCSHKHITYIVDNH